MNFPLAGMFYFRGCLRLVILHLGMVLHLKLADLCTMSSAYVSEFNDVPTSKEGHFLVTSEAPVSSSQSAVCNSR